MEFWRVTLIVPREIHDAPPNGWDWTTLLDAPVEVEVDGCEFIEARKVENA